MGFFEPPGPEPEVVVPPPYSPPIWTGPSELLLGTWVPAQRILAKTEDVAVALRGLCAYPNGFELHVSFLGRPPQNPQLHQGFFARLHAGRGPRFGLEFADGRRTMHGASGVRGFDARKDEYGLPTDPVMLPRGGGGGGGEYRQTFWVWPLPPPGRLLLFFDWADQHIAETAMELDGNQVQEAGQHTVELWPSGRAPVAGEPPFALPSGGSWGPLMALPPKSGAGYRAVSPGPPDPVGAERAIRAAFEVVYSSDRSDEERLAAVEGGDQLGPTMDQARQARRHQRGTDTMAVTVESVRFVATDAAEVSFELEFPTQLGSRFPVVGSAVLIDGTWKVARQTYCKLVESLGVQCPPHTP